MPASQKLNMLFASSHQRKPLLPFFFFVGLSHLFLIYKYYPPWVCLTPGDAIAQTTSNRGPASVEIAVVLGRPVDVQPPDCGMLSWDRLNNCPHDVFLSLVRWSLSNLLNTT